VTVIKQASSEAEGGIETDNRRAERDISSPRARHPT